MRTEEGAFSGGASFDPSEFQIPKRILALATMAWLRQILIPRCLRECTRLWRIQCKALSFTTRNYPQLAIHISDNIQPIFEKDWISPIWIQKLS